MNGGAGGSRRGSTKRGGRGRPKYAISCGSRLHWCSGLVDQLYAADPLGCTGPHALGTEFIRQVIEESIRLWYAPAMARATLLKARLGPSSTMAWALQELRLHEQGGREGVQRELLE